MKDFLGGTRFQTPNSVSFFGPHWVPVSEVGEFLSAYYLCAKANLPSFSQKLELTELRQNSVSSLFRNSTPETVFRPVPYIRPRWTKWTILVHFGLANAKIQLGIRSFWPKLAKWPFWSSTPSGSALRQSDKFFPDSVPVVALRFHKSGWA